MWLRLQEVLGDQTHLSWSYVTSVQNMTFRRKERGLTGDWNRRAGKSETTYNPWLCLGFSWWQ